MGAKGAVAPKAPDQVFGECCAALEVRSFSRLPAVQSAELYLTHSPRPARTHPARADREKTPATIAGNKNTPAGRMMNRRRLRLPAAS